MGEGAESLLAKLNEGIIMKERENGRVVFPFFLG